MITKEKAKEIAENFIRDKKLEYVRLNHAPVHFRENKEILDGNRKGEFLDVFIYHYTMPGVMEETGNLLYIDAKTGEVLYILGHHGLLDIEY